MYISTIISAKEAGIVKKKPAKAGTPGFSELIAESDAEETQAAGASSVSSASSLLFMQEIDEEEYQRKEAVKQGFDALKYLDNIRNSLLYGTLSKDTIIGLESTLQKFKKNFTDPHLTQVIEEIELRARVELAKLERN